MLGIILVMFGLVILPLVVSFMCEAKWYHIAALYDIALPAIIYYLGKKILSTRPTGYGDTDISDNPEIRKYKNILFKFGNKEVMLPPLYIALIFGAVFIFIGISPVIIHLFSEPGYDVIWKKS